MDISRLEFSKRDLLEAFKQVEVRLRTQINILNNTHNELQKWEEKKDEKNALKDKLLNEQAKIEKNYKEICEVLAVVLGKEPLEL